MNKLRLATYKVGISSEWYDEGKRFSCILELSIPQVTRHAVSSKNFASRKWSNVAAGLANVPARSLTEISPLHCP